MHLKLTNGSNPQHYSYVQLVEDYPEETFITMPSDSDLVQYEVYPYTVDEMPGWDEDTEVVQLGDFYYEDGKWHRSWVVVPLSIEEASRNKRLARDAKLMACDWTQVLDSPVNREAWAVYRQQLRDIPAQPGFPYNIVWPNTPT